MLQVNYLLTIRVMAKECYILVFMSHVMLNRH